MRRTVKKVLLLLLCAGGAAGVYSEFPFRAKSVGISKVDRAPALISVKDLHSSDDLKRTYRIKRKVHSRLGSRGESRTVMKLEYHGTLRLLPANCGNRGKGYLFSFQVETQGKERVLASHAPACVHFEEDLNGVKLFASREIGDSGRDELNMVRDMSLLFAFFGSRDTTGDLIQDFAKQDDRWIKSKKRYLNASARHVKISESHHEISLDHLGFPRALLGRDQTRIGLDLGMDLVTVSSYRIDLVQTEPQKGLLSIASGLSLEMVPLVIEQGPEPIEVLSYQSLKESLQDLARLSSNDRLLLFHEMRKKLQSERSLVQDFTKDFFQPNGSPERVRFGIGVLASLELQESQSALVDKYSQGDTPRAVKQLILNSLSTTDVPLSEQTKEFLLALPENEEGSVYALGASLRKERDQRIRDRLKRIYDSASYPSEKVLAIEGIGNSGDPFFHDTLMDAISDSSESVREKAAFASRFMPDYIRMELTGAAESDVSPRVRQAALDALQFRNQ